MKVITKNKRAYFDYEIIKSYEAGIVLVGHEVKSIKSSQCNIRDAIVKEHKGELFIHGMDVPLYRHTSLKQVGHYESKGRRKLLLHKNELAKIIIKMQQEKLQLIATQVHIGKFGKIKIQIGLAKRLRNIMKKQHKKENDQARQMDRTIRQLGL